MSNKGMMGRRSFLQLAAFSGLLSLSGCSLTSNKPILKLPRGVLPKELLQALSPSWKYQFLEIKSDIDNYQSQIGTNASLVALGDGWLKDCPQQLFQSIGANELYKRLNNQAEIFLNSLGASFASKVFPLAVSPWALIFRRGEEFLDRANESWEVLLDPALKRDVILPNSPRIVMSLAERMSDKNSLRKLRSQARSFDDRNGLNWLLSGKAKVAVLPLQYCLNNLTKDHRLSIALPKDGCPLNWTLLLRPKSALEPFPTSWVSKLWKTPLLAHLLSNGMIPPLSYSELNVAIDFLPEKIQFIYQSQKIFENSWSLSPLNLLEEKELERRWLNSSP